MDSTASRTAPWPSCRLCGAPLSRLQPNNCWDLNQFLSQPVPSQLLMGWRKLGPAGLQSKSHEQMHWAVFGLSLFDTTLLEVVIAGYFIATSWVFFFPFSFQRKHPENMRLHSVMWLYCFLFIWIQLLCMLKNVLQKWTKMLYITRHCSLMVYT